SLPRKKTVKRIMKKIGKFLDAGDYNELAKVMPSYLGYLQHANSYCIQSELESVMGYTTDSQINGSKAFLVDIW
ncbi:hypothetical protein KKE14_02640, partial [Patescibacteria group bacterium]|nr:hypothetical protein [Patescibacteria group bacterium]